MLTPSPTTPAVLPVILCGGSGTRLWPLSRAGFPKQFLCLTGRHSLFQLAAQRLQRLGPTPLVVCSEEHRFLAQEQLRELGLEQARLLLEPVARNTAAAVTLAALQASADGADPVLVVTPADQVVAQAEPYTRALQQAVQRAAEGGIVILGVPPDRPETGYGYIQASAGDSAGDTAGPWPVAAFVEKPDAATAERYLREGGYYWNAGNFVMRASVWLAALQAFRPDILQACQHAWAGRQTDQHFVRPRPEAFAAVPSESVDYAVLERCPGSAFGIHMVPLHADWSDLGAWDAVWQSAPKDPQGNALTGDVLTHDARDNLVHASGRLVALVGVSGLTVVETADAVLVADRRSSQAVKHIVQALGDGQRPERHWHRKVHRPWGWYDSIDEGERFKVKRIWVKPGASLSLQMHHHRAEHWVVVRGTAEVSHGTERQILSENQSTYIPLGQQHRLRNPGVLPLEIIEVQSGSYLGEDDIVRFEDQYGRG